MIPAQEEVFYNQKLLSMYRALLAEYLRQRELWVRTEIPEILINGITTLRRRIMDVKGTLRGWKVEVTDYPDDEDPSDDLSDEVAHQLKILKIYRTNLSLYLRQREQFDDHQVPIPIVNSISKARSEIQRIKAILRGWNVPVDDLPEEEIPEHT